LLNPNISEAATVKRGWFVVAQITFISSIIRKPVMINDLPENLVASLMRNKNPPPIPIYMAFVAIVYGSEYTPRSLYIFVVMPR
jgi:hypothetical protein